MMNPDTVQNIIGMITSHPSHMCQRRKVARNVIDHPLVHAVPVSPQVSPVTRSESVHLG
jgi:hypothetical protein